MLFRNFTAIDVASPNLVRFILEFNSIGNLPFTLGGQKEDDDDNVNDDDDDTVDDDNNDDDDNALRTL